MKTNEAVTVNDEMNDASRLPVTEPEELANANYMTGVGEVGNGMPSPAPSPEETEPDNGMPSPGPCPEESKDIECTTTLFGHRPLYMSPRGIPLITEIEPEKCDVITVEKSEQWYEAYVLTTEKKVVSLNDYCKRPDICDSIMHEYCFYPDRLLEVAREFNLKMDRNSYNAVMVRYLEEICEDYCVPSYRIPNYDDVKAVVIEHRSVY